MTIAEESLALHYEKKGKIEVVSTVPVATAHDLSLAYTPGVAAPYALKAPGKQNHGPQHRIS